MKRNSRSVLVLFMSAILGACSTTGPGTGTAPTNGASATGSPGGSSASAGANKVTVTSTYSGYPAGLDFSQIKYAAAEFGAMNDKKSVFIYLSNSDLSGMDHSNSKLAAGQGIVKLLLIRTGKDVDAGTYTPAAGTADLKVEPSIVVANGVTLQFSSFDTKGSVTLTSITSDKVTGTFDLKDNNSSISGSFDAPLKK